MKKLKDILPFIKVHQIKKADDFNKITSFWNTFYPSNLTNNCQPKQLKGSLLIIATSTPVWSHKMMINKYHVISKIQTINKKIRDIRFMSQSIEEILSLKKSFSLKQEKSKKENPSLKKIKNEIHNNNYSLNTEKIGYKLSLKGTKFKEKQLEQGWQICPNCGKLSKDHKGFCFFCTLALDKDQERKILLLLKEVPWIKYQDSNLASEISEEKFISVRYGLQEKLKSQLFYIVNNPHLKTDKTIVKNLIRNYVSLKTYLPPQKLTEAIIRKTLKSKLANSLT